MRKRAVTPALFAVVLAFGALAEVQPSQKLLDHEARTRASFTPAEHARVQALEARLTTKMTVDDVTTLAHGGTAGTLFAVLMEYQRMMGKEAREDRKLAQAAKEKSLAAKAAKLESDARQIDKQMTEANEKARSLMDSATTGLTLGAVAGGLSVGGGVASGQGTAGATGRTAGQIPAGVTASPAPLSPARVSVPTKTPTKTPAGVR